MHILFVMARELDLKCPVVNSIPLSDRLVEAMIIYRRFALVIRIILNIKEIIDESLTFRGSVLVRIL
jgi:hypothetical protein